MLRNAMEVWGGRVSFFEKCVTKMYGSTLLALRGGWWGSNFPERRYVTLEWPLMQDMTENFFCYAKHPVL